MNGKDRACNRRCREMAGSSPDWRMSSPSDEDRDSTTRSERGPLDAGGDDVAGGAADRGGFPLRRAWSSTGGVNAGSVRGHGGAGLNRDGPAEGSALNCKVPAA